MNSQPICIYHKDCSDGTSAAAVFLHKFPQGRTFPFAYGYTDEDAERVLSLLTPETVVYTVDCTLLARECLERGNHVISLDHHIGMFEAMTELTKAYSNYTYIFKNNLSGATLTWTYFFPNEPIPHWLKLVQDYDLWNKEDENADFFESWTYTQINHPNKILFLFENEDALESCLEKGRSIREFNLFYIEKFQEKAIPLYIEYKEYKIPMYNGTYLQNNLAFTMAKNDLGVASVFSLKGKSVRMSIRSIENSDVSALELAKHFGGGGHRNAAGCEILLSDFIAKIA